MTTIAYRDGIMAADSQVTDSSLCCGYVKKIGTTALGSLVGVSGTAGMLEEIIAWLDAGGKRDDYPKTPPDRPVFGLVAEISGRVGSISPEGIMQWIEAPYAAEGSGQKLAIGAMAAGASAIEAVRIASRFDIYSGGPIDILELHNASASPLPRTE